MRTFDFPVGYEHFHPTTIVNYQLNRWYSFGYARKEDMQEAGKQIKTTDDWKQIMVRQAEKAMQEGRLIPGTFYYRAAEFFTLPSDPDKIKLYDTFIDLFYHHAFATDRVERGLVPYQDGFLSTMRVPSSLNEVRGKIVVHGGFDSFIEELYSLAAYLSNEGYEVILFEGPGQGATLKEYGLPLTHEWEKPAKAVLDHYELDDVTWIGISMGGWLCFRAAAFEPRIQRVIASSIAFDYMQIPPSPVAAFAKALFRYPSIMNILAEWKMKWLPQEKWGIHNLMYITKKSNPMEASQIMLNFNEENLHSDKVKQDVLILTGVEDHFIPLKMHVKQVQALTHAKSVTERLFTREEQGHNHCQVGNFGLALQVMLDWIKRF